MFVKIALSYDKMVEVQLSLECFLCHRCFGFRKIFELVFLQGPAYCCILYLLLAWGCQKEKQCRGREVLLLIRKQPCACVGVSLYVSGRNSGSHTAPLERPKQGLGSEVGQCKGEDWGGEVDMEVDIAIAPLPAVSI